MMLNMMIRKLSNFNCGTSLNKVHPDHCTPFSQYSGHSYLHLSLQSRYRIPNGPECEIILKFRAVLTTFRCLFSFYCYLLQTRCQTNHRGGKNKEILLLMLNNLLEFSAKQKVNPSKHFLIIYFVGLDTLNVDI